MKIKLILASILLFVGLTLNSSIIIADTISVEVPTSATPVARWTLDFTDWNSFHNGLIETTNGSGIFDLELVGPEVNPNLTPHIGETVNSIGGSPLWDLQTNTLITSSQYNTATGFTWSMWARFSTLPTADYIIVQHGSEIMGTRGWKLIYDQTTGTLDFDSAPTVSAAYATTVAHTTVLALSTWYHIIIEYNGTNSASLSVNGTAVTGTPVSNSIGIPSERIFLLGDIPSADVNILIDELYLYDTDISAADVTALAGSQLPFSGDYLFSTIIDVQNTSTTTFSNETVAVNLNLAAMIAGSFVQANLSDLQIFQQTGNHAHTQIISPSTITGTAYSFVRLDTIPPSSFTTADMLTSLPTTCDCAELRSQAFQFTGDDEVIVADNADLDITDNLFISAVLELHANPGTDGWIVNKWTGGLGYSFGYNSSGDLQVRLDGTTLTATPSGTENNFAVSKIGTNVVFYEGSDAISSQTGPATITANAVALNIGTTLDADIYEVDVVSAFDQGGERSEVFFDFQQGRYTETQEGLVGNGWVWLGNLTHTGLSSTTATYSIDNDMDDFTITVGDLTIIASEIDPNLAVTNPDIIGTLTDLAGSSALISSAGPNIPFRALINNIALSMEVNVSSVYFPLMLAVAYMLAIIVAKTLRNTLLAIMTIFLTLLGGSSADLYAHWMTVFVAVYSFSFYAIDALRKSRSI